MDPTGPDRHDPSNGAARRAGEPVRANGTPGEDARWLRSALRYAAEVVAFAGPDGKIHYVSPSVEQVLGYTPEEIVGKSGLEYVHPDDSGRLVEALSEVRGARRIRRLPIELRCRHKDGTWRQIESVVTYLKDPEVEGVVINSRDVTECKEIEERFRTLVERVPAITYIQRIGDGASATTYVSPQVADVVGYTPEECTSTPDLWVKILHPDDRERVLAEDRRTNTTGESFAMEYRQIARDGSVVWLRDEASLVRDEGGKPLYWLGVQVDITERKWTEEALREAEERYRTLVEQIPAVTYIDAATDGPDESLYTSPQIEGMLGYTQGEWRTGKLWEERLHPDDRERILAADERFEGGEARFGEEYRLLARDGSVVWVHEEAVLVKDEEGEPLYWQGVIFDVTEQKEAEEALKESEERFRSLVQNASEVILITEGDGSVRYVSPALEKILGYKPEDVVGNDSFEVVHPEDVATVQAVVAEAIESPGTAFYVELRLRHADGSWRHMESNCTSLLGDPAVSGIVFNSRDVTGRKRAKGALRESEERFRRAFEDAAVGMALIGLDGRYLRVNRSLCEILGYPEEELLGKTFQDVTHPDDLEKDLEHLERLLAGSIRTYQMEKRFLRKEGHVVWVLLSVSLVRDEDGEPLYLVSQIQDISERKRMEDQLQRQALHDDLTGLPNRKLFMDRLGQALERTRRRRGHRVAVLFMDLDEFKVVNDSLGHEAGDLLLVVVAQRLGRCLRPEDTLARFGGDEFVVLIEDVDDPVEAAQVAERIGEELRRPFVLEGRELYVSASIGVSFGTARTKTPEDLLRDADTAMYRAKDEAADYRVFDSAMYGKALRRLELENDLRRAIERGEFVVCYQPIFDFRTGAVWGMEALVRWVHPERGLLGPSEFVHIAEETGLVVPLGAWVLEEACRRTKGWQDSHPRNPPLRVIVNLSARQLRHPGCEETIRAALARSGLGAHSLSLDVTESAFIDALEGNARALERIQALGVRISIDDFGMGYSSLSYLKRLPADALKIDKSFVKGLGEDAEDTAIVRMVIDVAHTLNLEVVAEGVETWAQAALLEETGCDMAQGYHFAKPLSADEVLGILAD